MSELLSSLEVPTAPNSSGRKSNYTQIYPKDEKGDEAKDYARVWNVYLDERENYDAAMIQSFRNIVDNLLTFATLFAGIVATFVVTTASELAPDDTPIIAALLVENNQLLRAAGNSTSLNAVPPASLNLGGPTLIDLWVNGLFFTSLALSLLTALATVLVKQWLQSYTLLIPGTAKDRALVSHFRFEGFVRWHLPTIVESLPLILHGSLALFLAGFALYAFQLFRPICWTIVGISAIAFIFYFGSFLLPAFFADCPYYVPFLWYIPKYVIYPLRLVQQTFAFLWRCSKRRKVFIKDFEWPACQKSRTKTEYDAVLPLVSGKSLKKTFCPTNQNICDALCWIFYHSSHQSVKDVVVEAVTGLLHDWTALLQDLVFEKPQVSELDFETVVGNVLMHDLFPAAVDYSLKKLSTRKFESTMEHDNVGQTSYGQFLQALLATTSSQPSLMKGLSIGRAEHPWRKKIQDKLDIAYRAVALKGDHILSKKLLGWGACILPTSTTSEMLFLQDVASRGDAQIITDILDRKPEYLNQIDCHGLSALHFAASHGRLDAVTVLVERGASLDLLSNSPHDPLKAIDLAIRNDHPEVVAYLLDHHADRPAYALHEAAKFQDSQMAKVLLDRGWVKLEKNDRGQTPVDVATALGNEETAKFLDEYEPSWLNATFPHQHNQNMSPFPSTH
ncbi:Integrin-linked protein kinase [Termitomyces sp. T112]|nr:Integrin-linked protein kinase [Termitomyces sp. T112]